MSLLFSINLKSIDLCWLFNQFKHKIKAMNSELLNRILFNEMTKDFV